MVGERLGWKVYDEELIEAIAHRMEVPIDEVRALDEQAPSMVQDWLLPLREEYYAPQEAYLDHLAKLIEAIGRAGESILVGRGAGFMLPRETTLSLRVIAPLKVRAQRLAERMGVSVRTARRAARDLDRRRAQFDRTMHRADPNDPHHFDLVLDTASLGLDICRRSRRSRRRGGTARRPLAVLRSTRPAGAWWSPPAARKREFRGLGLRSGAAEPPRSAITGLLNPPRSNPTAQGPQREQAPPHDRAAPRPNMKGNGRRQSATMLNP